MIQRKSPLRSVSPNKRPRRWTCTHCKALVDPGKRKCHSCGIGRATKRKSLASRADALWSQLVKAAGVCEATLPWGAWSFNAPPRVKCLGGLEAAHVVPRKHRSTRWLRENGRAICHGHHRYFTGHEKAWRDFIGPEWDRLWDAAQELWDRDYPAVIADLQRQLAAAKEKAV